MAPNRSMKDIVRVVKRKLWSISRRPKLSSSPNRVAPAEGAESPGWPGQASMPFQPESGRRARLPEYEIQGSNGDYNPLISVVVPCYNHRLFLQQRLSTIYDQSYDNFEVLLLDDASTDGSVDVLEEYRSRFPGKTRLLCSETNSGSPFRQ